MRQTFFHELEELEKRERQEKKAQVEFYLRAKSRERHDYLPFVFVVSIGIFAGIVTIYALYLFINVSRLGNFANVHVTNVLELAYRTVKGNVYNNEQLGIKNWVVFSDDENGIELRYPASWKIDNNKEHLFEIDKYNSQASINESLSAAVFLDDYENMGKLSLEDFVLKETGIGRESFSKQIVSDVEYIKTGKQKDDTGFLYSIVFWENKGRIYSLKAVFYNQKNQVTENEFNKMISVMQITK